ncbi:MAG: aldo/keto reductase [Lachnospiraceae bacterium]|nr:aldo/keto reductase [Lachnospiraceae bacterium]
MKKLLFGETKTEVSEVVLGLMRIAPGSQAKRLMEVGEVEELVHAALESGINMLDIADVYGRGACETLLGEVFARNDGLRDKVFLQSKCGIRKGVDGDITYYDFSKDYILSATDGILQRLQTDHLDCLLLHRPDALMEPEEIAEAFETLKSAGKVLNFGVSNCNPMILERLRRVLPMPLAADQMQLSCAFTPMIDAGVNVNMQNDASVMRDGGTLEYCAMNDITVQAWSSLQHGFFGGVFIGSDEYKELNKVLDRIAAEKNVTPAAVALAWILRYPSKMQAVIGTTNPAHVREAAAAQTFELTRKEWYEIYLSAGNTLP